MLTGALEVWFRGLPGERNVRAGMFYILNATKGNQAITSTTWCQAVTHGVNLQMYVMVESKSLHCNPSLACERQSNNSQTRTISW